MGMGGGLPIVPGQPSQLRGSGFVPGGTVVVYAMPSMQPVGWNVVRPNGTVFIAPMLPPSMAAGTTGLQLAGQLPGGMTANVGIPITVLSPAAPVPKPDGQLPAPAAGGTYVTVDRVPVPTEPRRVGTDLEVTEQRATVSAGTRSSAGTALPPTASGLLRIVEGGSLEVSGDGMRGWVDVFAFSKATYVGRIQVGRDGRFTGVLPVPASLAAGRHTLQLVGKAAANGREVAVSLPVEKAGARPTTAWPGRLRVWFPAGLHVVGPKTKRFIRPFITYAATTRPAGIVVKYPVVPGRPSGMGKARAVRLAAAIRVMLPGTRVVVRPARVAPKRWPARTVVITVVPRR